MKLKTLGIALAVFALAACNSRHESVTGSYGQNTVSGQVVMTGLQNNSPEGLQVSVRGTGMAMTLASDGQFVFAGVPDGAQLDFARASDGVAASLKLDAGSGFVVVEVSQSSAKKSSRRRSSGPTRDKVYEFEGLIRSVSDTQLVVFTSHQEEVTFALTPDTVIRKGNRTYLPAELQVDWRVHVKASKGADGAYTAVSVWVQNTGGEDDDPPATTVREYEGTVRSVSDTQLVVFTSHKEEVTFALTADTIIRKGNTPVAPADILVGMRVHVKATANADGTNTATQVIVQNTRVEVEIEGTVASVGASSLVVTTATGDVTVNVSASTQIRKSGKKITLAEVAAGDNVEVEGTQSNATTIDAKKITVEND